MMPPSDQDFRPNGRATAGAIVLVLVLLVLGVWTLGNLDKSQKAQACLESGGKKCALIDPSKSR